MAVSVPGGVILFDEKCRLCLEKPGINHIFETRELQQDIFTCTGVKILQTDGLPQKICSKCTEIISNAKELKSLAAKNDRYLKLLFEGDDDDDDSSRDTLVIDVRPEMLEHINVESQQNTDHTDNQENVTSTNNSALTVRNDLFSTTSKKNLITVKSKEDYDKIKKTMKADPNSKVVYECEPCSKSFDTYKKLYLHIRLHNKKIECPLDGCEKKFATNGDLEKHLRTHTGVKPYTCEICEKKFTQQGSLKAHKENVHFCITVP